MFSIEKDNLYQWDSNIEITVGNDDIKQIHFCNKTDECSLVVDVVERKCFIPNILLTQSMPIQVYGYDGEKTLYSKKYNVKPRSKPADYIYTETEVIDWRETVGEIETCLDKIIDIEFEILGIPNFENPITFYLEGTPYVANEGMSWEEYIDNHCPTHFTDWCCNDERNLFYYGYNGEEDQYVYVDNCCGPPYYLELDGNYVSKQDTIVPEGHYSAVQ